MTRIILCLIAFIIAGCAATLDMNVISPAGNTDAAAYKNIAVLIVSGDSEEKDYTRKFEDVLSNLNFGGKSVFTVNKSSALRSLRQSSSFDNPQEIAEAAKKLGMQALWVGSLSEEYSASSYKKTKNSCDEIKPGGPGDNCGSYLTTCSKKIITVSANMRLFSGETGDVVYSGVILGDATADMCVDDSEQISERTLRDRAVEQIAKKFVKEIAPHETTIKVGIMTDADGIKDTASVTLFENGIGFAQEKRMDKACFSWDKAFEKNPYAAGLMYNIALCREFNGDYEGALTLLNELDKILPPASFINKFNNFFKVQELPNDLVVSAIERNKKHIADRERLNEQTVR